MFYVHMSRMQYEPMERENASNKRCFGGNSVRIIHVTDIVMLTHTKWTRHYY